MTIKPTTPVGGVAGAESVLDRIIDGLDDIIEYLSEQAEKSKAIDFVFMIPYSLPIEPFLERKVERFKAFVTEMKEVLPAEQLGEVTRGLADIFIPTTTDRLIKRVTPFPKKFLDYLMEIVAGLAYLEGLGMRKAPEIVTIARRCIMECYEIVSKYDGRLETIDLPVHMTLIKFVSMKLLLNRIRPIVMAASVS